MRNVIGVFVAILIVLATAPAYAAEQQTAYPDPCQGTMDIDTCMWSDMITPSTGQFTSCTATGSQGQTCQEMQYDDWGTRICAGVRYNAKCNCDAQKNTSSGQCTYVQ